jgi:hypothetical protein
MKRERMGKWEKGRGDIGYSEACRLENAGLIGFPLLAWKTRWMVNHDRGEVISLCVWSLKSYSFHKIV